MRESARNHLDEKFSGTRCVDLPQTNEVLSNTRKPKEDMMVNAD
jgi:hypothetical protein